MKLFVYDHCPYCVRARMPFALKDLPLDLVVMLNDDVETPTSMIGKKMVPILELPDGRFMPESMDIVQYLDGLDGLPIFGPASERTDYAEWCSTFRPVISRLTIPRYPQAPLAEFATDGARAYFTEAKTNYLGDFAALLATTPQLIAEIETGLAALDAILTGPYVNDALSLDDVDLFGKLRGLTLVAGISWPKQARAYIDRFSESTHIPLYDDLAI